MTIWEAAEARDEAMVRVEQRSAPWRAVAFDTLCKLARSQPVVTSEDVFLALDAADIPRPVDGRAMGPVMSKARREGVLRLIGYGRSTDKKHHRDIQARYESLLWRP